MGIKIEVDGHLYEAVEYSVNEESTPLSAGDSSGSVGTISFVIPAPDPAAPETDPLVKYGPSWFIGKPVTLSDSYNGYTLGTVKSYSYVYDGANIQLNCLSRLSELNIYNVNAQPYVGTLGGAFEYYLSLAGITSGLFVDDSIASRPVALPGFTGELWFRLKQLSVAQDCDISLVSGVILLRPIRARIAETGKAVQRTTGAGGGNLAQTVEVYWYESEAITDELVWPPGGWNPEVEVFNVNSGEWSEYSIELSASVSSIQAPVMQTFVSQDYDASSVFTIVADDGLPVSPSLWADHGGKLELTINEDTTSLTLRLFGARDIPLATGGMSRTFAVALASDSGGSSRYSTLRIVGTGVRYVRRLRVFRTGVTAAQTATEVGETIDNPMITDLESLRRAGVRAAKRWAGVVPNMAGSVTAVNRRGDSGSAKYPTYGEIESELKSELGTPTYGDVETYYVTTLNLPTYTSIRQYWFETVQDDYENQVFGNVNGARVWDSRSRRWYRIRSGTINRGLISFDSADDDLTHTDIELGFAGVTYGDVQVSRDGLTYQEDYLLGVYRA